VVLLGCFMVHFKVLRCDFTGTLPLSVWLLIPFLFILFKSVFPWRDRKPAWRALLTVLSAPTVEVTFLANYVGDVLTSMVKDLVDLAYSFCFFLSGDFMKDVGEENYVKTLYCNSDESFFKEGVAPFIILLPYWLRLMQCLRRYVDSGHRHPHLPNAFKYTLSLLVTVFGIFRPAGNGDWEAYDIAWRLVYLTSTLYSWSWDVRKDWSLFQRGTVATLRTRRMLSPRPGVYYAAAVADLVLRFAWAYTLIPDSDQKNLISLGSAMAPITAALEIIRRSMWSVLRLENEHLHNTSGFRTLEKIPMHFDVTAREVPKGLAGAKPGSRRRVIIFEVGFYTLIVVLISSLAIFSHHHHKDLDGDGDDDT
jgi:xenotropic and polytropic retrovirus receptor 1